jgi:hypothetical protein
LAIVQKQGKTGNQLRGHRLAGQYPVHFQRRVRRSDNLKILRTSFPFSMFLTSRIFWGHDLDFRGNIYNDIAAGNSRLIDPDYLGVINIYYEDQRPVTVSLADIWQEI